MIRHACGSLMGLLLHRDADESPCASCLRGEMLRRLSLEEVPTRPAKYAPVTPEQAARNRTVLWRATKPKSAA